MDHQGISEDLRRNLTGTRRVLCRLVGMAEEHKGTQAAVMVEVLASDKAVDMDKEEATVAIPTAAAAPASNSNPVTDQAATAD